MIPLNYHHLFYFWTVGRLGSISGAAHELYLSQPTLSGQIKELEQSFHAKLLVRGRSGVALTPEGRAVFERCERIFSEGAELASFVRNGYKAASSLRLGLRPTVPREAALRLLRLIREKDRSCRVTIFSGEAEVLLSRLRQGSLDLVVANQDLSAGSRELRGRLVSELPVFFVASRKVKRAIGRFPADLAKVPLLLRPADNPVRKQVDQFLSRRRLTCAVEADSDDVELLRRLAIEGRGVTALSGLAVADDLKTGRLRALHASPVGIREPIWLVCPTQPKADPSASRVLDTLMTEFTLFGAPAVRSHLGS